MSPCMTNLAGIHPALQVACTEHGGVHDRSVNIPVRTFFLVDQQNIGL